MKDERNGVVNCAYVIDKQYRITHYNNAIKKLYPDLETGDVCYKKLQGLEEPCKVCPLNTPKMEGLLYYNRLKNAWIDCMAAPLDMMAEVEDQVVICHVITEMREDQKEQALRLLAGEGKERDSLTGLYNRETFFRKVDAMMQAARPAEYCMLALDVENFKLYNTMYGFSQGNDFLRYIGYSMQEVLRNTGFAGYIGEDNFAAFLPNRQSLLADISERLKYYIDRRKQNPEFYPAMGIYVIEDVSLSVESFYDYASMARTLLRGNHLSRMIWYDESMIREMEENYKLLNDLKRGLQQEEFVFYLQPKCDMRDGRIVGMEALCRWMHPEKGLLSPGAFVPKMEANGLITELDCQIWEKVCRMIRDWEETGIRMIPVSINVSRIDFFELDVARVLDDLVKKYGISKKYLEVEVTESAYAENELVVKRTIDKLRGNGFTVSMDDFGSGYSSLNMLQNVSVDILKLDMRFLQLEDDSKKRGIHILEMIVHLARSLNVKIIAEGVETDGQKKLLLDMGCEYAQGYYYYRPVAVEDAEKLLKHSGTGEGLEAAREKSQETTEQREKGQEAIELQEKSQEAIELQEKSQEAIGQRENSQETTELQEENREKTELREESSGKIETAVLSPEKLIAQLYDLSEKCRREQKRAQIYEAVIMDYFDEKIELDYRAYGSDKAVNNVLTILDRRWKLSFTEKDKIRTILALDYKNTGERAVKVERVTTEDSRELILFVLPLDNKKAFLYVRDQGKPRFEKVMLKHPLLWSYDYDVETDVMEVLSREEGKERASVRIRDFKKRVNAKGFLADESIQHLRKEMLRALQTPAYGVTEFETDDAKGKKLWKRLYYLSLANQRGKIYRVVGIAGDIEQEHSSVEAWKDRANRDQMTGFFNHDASLYYMAEALRDAGSGTLLSLDIDNFKQINDTAGHMQGDYCIQKLAELLRRTFRKDDIIGRMGGDEFLIFMPGVMQTKTAVQRIQDFFEELEKLQIPRTGKIKCSVGISSGSFENMNINSLFKQADYALYEAKNEGKGHVAAIEKGRTVHYRSNVQDSQGIVEDEKQKKKLEFIGKLFLMLYHSGSREAAIDRALAFIGEKLDVSRVYIFEFEAGGVYARNTYEWCASGIVPEKDHLQRVTFQELGFDLDRHYENDLWFCPDVSMLQEQGMRELLEQQHIKGMLHWLFRKNGELQGMIGFDECRDNIIWSTQYAEVLQNAGKVLSQYLLSEA